MASRKWLKCSHGISRFFETLREKFREEFESVTRIFTDMRVACKREFASFKKDTS
jgi:hypothetical protein